MQNGKIHVAWDPNRPGGVPAFPGFSDCLQALRALLERTLFTQKPIGWLAPPFEAVSVHYGAKAVLNIPTATDSVANETGDQLYAVANAFANGYTVVNLEETGMQKVLRVTAPQGKALIIRSIGLTVEVGNPAAVKTALEIEGGPNTSSHGPDPEASGAYQGEQQPTMIILPDNKSLTILAENLETNVPVLVKATVDGWTVNMPKWNDDSKSFFPILGFGTCQRD